MGDFWDFQNLKNREFLDRFLTWGQKSAKILRFLSKIFEKFSTKIAKFLKVISLFCWFCRCLTTFVKNWKSFSAGLELTRRAKARLLERPAERQFHAWGGILESSGQTWRSRPTAKASFVKIWPKNRPKFGLAFWWVFGQFLIIFEIFLENEGNLSVWPAKSGLKADFGRINQVLKAWKANSMPEGSGKSWILGSWAYGGDFMNFSKIGIFENSGIFRNFFPEKSA